ncbi:hypothetical protein DN452_03900 [Lactobacillus reuteri]|uniref:hypothetical protein n=1 Tax=Limosilactobacillus reuteri TaxID=1598 RepID=UPI00128B1300|nr:hypothetical protein [Limosilactobacillus reuteri]MQB62178.1 hypothetical protein [Limosilactobacillus reuteri]MQB80481.1 hypothetical protein [Limosilactobacillus reuteri]MQB86839.1 hypothetical protein [Limosilactobacillus reuteri]
MTNNIKKANKRFYMLGKIVKIEGSLSKEICPEYCSDDPDGYYDGTYEISCKEGYWAECYLHSFWHIKWWIKFLRNPNDNWDYDKMDEVNKIHKLNTYHHNQEYKDHFW